jgi:hypothetical protein
MPLPAQLLEGVAQLIRETCTAENNYTYIEFATIGEYNYKVTIKLQEVDEQKEARITSIIVKRED